MVSVSKRFLLSIAMVACLTITASNVQAQRGGPPTQGGFGFGGFGGGSETFLLSNTSVQKELDLLDDQIAKIRELSEKQREGARDLFSGFRDLNEEQRNAKMEEIRTKMQARNEETKKQLGEILLPHQMKRLSEISRQQRIRGDGRSGSFSVDVVASELKLSDEQKEKLKAKAEEVQGKIRERLAKVRQEAENDILSVLTPEQRAQWKDLVGEAFDYQPTAFTRTRTGGDDNNRRRPGTN